MKDFAHKLYYLYRRNRWMLDPARLWGDFGDIPIDRPIFLLGTQGGGLTLLSRMLRRNIRTVSVTGDHQYWSGADEMQNVLGPILPPQLTGVKYQAPPDALFGTPRGWVYATDRLLPLYRLTAAHVTRELAHQFRRLLQWVIWRQARRQPGKRLVDKSQVFTVKVSFINALLNGCNPRFVLLVRNPYVLCYRAAARILWRHFTMQERLEYAAQHWSNSMSAALTDAPGTEQFALFRFEDLLVQPSDTLRAICAFTDIEFDQQMLPSRSQSLPLGTLRRDRWFPLRQDVDEVYCREIQPEHVEIIDRRCGELARRFGYRPPA